MKKILYSFIIFFSVILLSQTIYGKDGISNVNICQKNRTTIYISWNSNSEYDAFELYRSENNLDWKKIKTVREETTYNYNLSEKIKYGYKIRGIKKDGTEIIYSDFSEPVYYELGKETDSIDFIKSYQTSKSSISITWDEKKVDGYEIYQLMEEGNWKKIKETLRTSCSINNLTSSTKYSFKVCCYNNNEVGKTYSYFSNVNTIELKDTNYNPHNLTISQTGVKSVKLSWDEIEGADSYSLYRSEDGKIWNKIKNVTTNETYNYQLQNNKVYSYKVKVNTVDGISVYSSFSNINSISLLSLNKIEDLSLIEYSEAQISLSWSDLNNIDGYRLYRRVNGGEWVSIKYVTTSHTHNASLSEGNIYEYYVVAYKKFSDGTIYSSPSNIVLFDNINKEGQFRALLIGETDYLQTLHGPDNDVMVMKEILDQNGYDTLAQTNLTKSEIIELIDLFFEEATEDDVSLFYYSGHGITGAGEYYSGALHCIDYKYIATEELAEILSSIPGKKIVILDSCGSGATISDEMIESTYETEDIVFLEETELTNENVEDSDEKTIIEADFEKMEETEIDESQSIQDYDPEIFNNSVIQAFSLYDNLSYYSSELKKSGFYVLTSSGYEQNSLTLNDGNVWGGALTRAISSAFGRDYVTGTWSSSMVADVNKDGKLTLNELYSYCFSQVKKYQDIQVYPENSDLFLSK